MSMEELLELLMSSETETEVLEFKEAKNSYSKDKLGQYFSALGNEANLKKKDRAYILLGVNNQQEIVGTDISDATLNEYKKEMADHTSPSLSFSDVQRIHTPKGAVIMLVIPPAPQGIPISWKGHRYGRNGESIGGLNDFELLQITSQKTDWSAQIIENAILDDLSLEAIEFAKIQYAEKNPKLQTEIASWSDAVFLDKVKVTIKGKITNTAILLLGKPESEHYINPATARITWILKDKDNLEKDYEHFYNPLIRAVEQVSAKIRNLKYRYIKSGSLFPDEVDQYDPYIIREALHNCIAHQDYTLGGKVIVVESEDGWLSFTNSGSFIPKSVEEVVMSDSPEPTYRNTFLVGAMVNLNMIDTIGSGIKRMYNIQRKKFFPLPEYDLSDKKVKVTISGKVMDLKYARKIAEMPNLNLDEIILLDKISKSKPINDEEAKKLKAKSLIEGRKPNYHISAIVAINTNEKEQYIKNRGFKDVHYKKMILDYIDKYGSAYKANIDQLLLDILPAVLDEKQKLNKVRNLIYALSKKDKIVENQGTTRHPKWIRKTKN
jgi:ATP-dependent DNA helicase RecG